MQHDTTPLWIRTADTPTYPALDRDLDVDVAIVGAGVTGLTAAVLLSRSGLRVAVLERNRVGHGETGHTTSHLTEAVDARYQTIVKDFSEDAARQVAQSSRDAIDQIESLVRDLRIECGFERTPGYLYSERAEEMDWLANELDAAQRAGCPVQWVDQTMLPFHTKGAVRWNDQAQFHPTAYLAGLAKDAAANGVHIFERTPVRNVDDGEPCRIETGAHAISARHVLVAANVPVNNTVFMHTKIFPYRTYAIAAPVRTGYLQGLFWDTDDPYHYTRTHVVNGQWYLIVGGEDHKTGEEENTDERFERVIAYARERFEIGDVAYRWSGQIIETADGLPYIGLNTGSTHVFVATGYSGNGMTFGTLAGMMGADAALGRRNPYADLYDATRVKPVAGAYEFVKENVKVAARLVADRLTNADADVSSLDELQPGEGGIFASEEGKLAVYRDDRGKLHALSPVCTHLACDVAWNKAETSWDCPCHGSRFTPEGKVINGPAVTDLEPKSIPAMREG